MTALIGYVLIAILIFGVLVFVHELGHFLTAKAMGVRVNEFSVCMGPAIWQKTVGETTYSLRCIPIGGYCAMEGEDEKSDDPRAFTSAPAWKRLLILIAGSFFNLLIGVLLLAIVYGTAKGYVSPQIDGFFAGSAVAEETGLREGDVLYRIDGRRVFQYSDISLLLSRTDSTTHDLVVKRGGKLVTLEDSPLHLRELELDGEKVLKYGLTFRAKEMTFTGVLSNTVNTAADFARIIWMSLADLVKGKAKVDDMSGPVGIVSAIAETGQSSETKADAALNISYFAAFLAVNLAVMNLLPIPALDGGRAFLLLVTAAIEAVTRKKVDPKYEAYIHAAGMLLLLAFIAFITVKDVLRLIG